MAPTCSRRRDADGVEICCCGPNVVFDYLCSVGINQRFTKAECSEPCGLDLNNNRTTVNILGV